MVEPIDRMLAAAVEGQARSPRFIQRQLSLLREALATNGSAIRAAIRKDSNQTAAEIEIQYMLTLEVVAQCFAESDFDKALSAEYALARSENSPQNRSAFGVAYIEPARYNLLFSSIAALAMAIAAGNCVILELSRTLSETSEVLRTMLTDTLDNDTFAVVENPPDFSKLTQSYVRLHASPNSDIAPAYHVLCVPTTRSVAIVDRYADMQKAATAIVRARFSFEGQSPVAPHLVLVNEFRIKEFCSAIAEQTSKYFASQVGTHGSSSGFSAAKIRSQRASANELDKAGAETLISGSRGVVVRINDRQSPLLRKTINEPLLIIHPVRSLDDALDSASTTSKGRPLTALHVFGSPEVGKYTSQFLPNHLTCVNDIPIELIAAPLTPLGFATQVGRPYTKEMFSEAKPQYIEFNNKSKQLAALIETNDEAGALRLLKLAESMDTRFKQPAGHAIGYFEQGILVGAAVSLTTVVGGIAAVLKFGLPMSRARR